MTGPPPETSDDERGLIFQWERRARSRWRLALMIVLSLLLHAASFYVLQVAYTPTGSQLPPPAGVVLVPLDRPENASLARWMEVNDPALLARPTGLPAAQVLDSLGFHYVPSYDAAPPPFKPLDPRSEAAPSSAPRPFAPGPVPPPPLPAAAASAGAGSHRAASGQTTELVFAGELRLRPGTALPPVRFSSEQGNHVLDPTVFLVGLRAGGGEPFLFRQSGSGDAAADAYARDYLLALGDLRRPGSDPAVAVTWGTATFYWGNDVYRRP